MPTRLCNDGKCANPATYRGRCQDHARRHNTNTHHNRHIYGTKRWQILRRHVLTNQPLCPCGEIATDVDHVVAIQDGGNPWSLENLKGLCGPCHARKTAAEVRARG